MNEVASSSGIAEGFASSFIMNGGTIRDNTASHNGGGLFIAYEEDICSFEMNGGLLFDNLAGDETLYAGDDILDERQGATDVIFEYPSREYDDILPENNFLNSDGGDLEVPFIGWFVDDADNRFISPTESTMILQSTASTTGMKAIWGGYTVTYDANHGSGEQTRDAVAYVPGSEVAVKENMFEYAGHKFIGWNTEADGTGEWFRSAEQPDNSFIITSNVFLYAQWEKLPAGSLTISKTVTGSGDQTKGFSFLLTLSDASDTALTDSFAYTGNGVADGTIKSGDTVTLAHGQSITISGLPAGTKYTVTEGNADGYTVSVNGSDTTVASGTISEDQSATAAFTNHMEGGNPSDTPEPASVTLRANKTLDGNTPTGSSFTFLLKDENGRVIQTAQNDGENIVFPALSFSQTGTFTYFITEQTGNDNGIIYDTATYKVIIEVTQSDDYHATVSYEKDGAAYAGTPVFANVTKPTTPEDTMISVTVNKVWDDNNSTSRPSAVEVQLYKNGAAYGSTISLSAANGWQYTWSGLDRTAIWTVDEISSLNGYIKSVTHAGNSWTVTNTLESTPTPDDTTTSVTVNKVWSDDNSTSRPSAVEVQLYKNGAAYGSTISLSAANSWQYTWSGLDRTATWTVDEISRFNGYTTTVTHNGNSWTVTNTRESTDVPNDPVPGAPATPDNPQPPKDDVPKTGDETNVGLWIFLMLVSLSGIVAIYACTKKKRYHGTRQR